jgi:hypothetical protein
MHEYDFVKTLEKLPTFKRQGRVPKAVNEARVPPWRSAFTGLMTWGRCAHYKVPTFDEFVSAYKKGVLAPDWKGRYDEWFKDKDNFKKFKPRMARWYESGIADTHLQLCLQDTIEDRGKIGICPFDSRLDWKMKFDAIVIIGICKIYIDTYFDNGYSRKDQEDKRETNEQETKTGKEESSHWFNEERDTWHKLTITRSNTDHQDINGYRLFSTDSINKLLEDIYTYVGTTEEKQVFIPTTLQKRKAFCKSFYKKKST